MSKLLTEAELIELSSKTFLPFLEEYLIISDGISIQEGQIILEDVEKEVKGRLTKMWENFKKKRKILEKMKIREIDRVSKSNLSREAKRVKIASINKKYNNLKNNSLAAYKAYKKDLLDRYKDTIESVKKAIWKRGTSSKGLSLAKKFGNLTKLGKAGIITTGTLAAAGTYAGYRAKKNRELALPSKKYMQSKGL